MPSCVSPSIEGVYRSRASVSCRLHRGHNCYFVCATHPARRSYIVKAMTSTDIAVLRDILPRYAEYLRWVAGVWRVACCVWCVPPKSCGAAVIVVQGSLLSLYRSHPSSLLVKFLLCVEIRLYTKKLWFVVMNNIFPLGVTIHERYDLKVSCSHSTTVLLLGRCVYFGDCPGFWRHCGFVEVAH